MFRQFNGFKFVWNVSSLYSTKGERCVDQSWLCKALLINVDDIPRIFECYSKSFLYISMVRIKKVMI